MSLRRRLLVTIGVSLSALWLLAAGWLLLQLHDTVRDTLDQRLAASAHMVAGLISQVPRDAWRQSIGPVLSTPPGQGVACQIRSVRGRVLLRTRGELEPVLRQAPPGFSERTFNGQRWRVFTDVQNGLAITVADRLTERRQLQLGIVLTAALPFVFALIGSLVIGWWAIRRGLRPLERLRRELARRDPDALTPVRVDDAPRELAPVIDTLNGLLQRTDDAIRREQRFTDDAAHELRTPLTAIKTHVQLARRVDAARARDELGNVEAGVARLQRTLEQLLLLARVESGQAWPAETAPATVADVVGLAMADVGEPGYIQLTGDPGDATPLDLPRELAVAALRNLLANALQHAAGARSVRVHVAGGSDRVAFEVINDSTPVEPAGRQRFERGRGSSGSGLGLAIVDAIVARFDGTLHIEHEQSRGFCARLLLPVDASTNECED
ncbi:ATP-binding protein [Salinisphaera orenii]|uniref:ATP-binding protein n=1 Tax=Salinisphaera orenii TaxID=856731 RepID=UPI000DBE2CA3